NGAVRALIKEGKTNQIRRVIQTSAREGSQTLERSLSQLLRSGRVSHTEARSRSFYPQEIAASGEVSSDPAMRTAAPASPGSGESHTGVGRRAADATP